MNTDGVVGPCSIKVTVTGQRSSCCRLAICAEICDIHTAIGPEGGTCDLLDVFLDATNVQTTYTTVRSSPTLTVRCIQEVAAQESAR